MDRLKVCMDVLRRLVKEADDPNHVVLAEREINDYLKEIDALKAAIERVGKAIDEEAAKGQGELEPDGRLGSVVFVRDCPARSKNGRKTNLEALCAHHAALFALLMESVEHSRNCLPHGHWRPTDERRGS
jgi:hypothetical protein